MRDLIKQEQFELEVLENLTNRKLLNGFVFTGGTMLRLCFGLNRYSVDLDFWTIKDIDFDRRFAEMNIFLQKIYQVKDADLKKCTLLFEVRSSHYPRNLKIEIRRELKNSDTEEAIAYSAHSNRQILLRVASLPEMIRAKVAALIDRNEIRDAFDIEFLLKKGIPIPNDKKLLEGMLLEIHKFIKTDTTSKLGLILEGEQRKFYVSENFKILKLAIKEKLIEFGENPT